MKYFLWIATDLDFVFFLMINLAQLSLSSMVQGLRIQNKEKHFHFQLERKRGLGAGRVLWQQLAKERELFVQRQVSLPCLKHSWSCPLRWRRRRRRWTRWWSRPRRSCLLPSSCSWRRPGSRCRRRRSLSSASETKSQNVMHFYYHFRLLLFMNSQSRELECPVCLTEMLPPIRIWQVQPSLKENL